MGEADVVAEEGAASHSRCSLTRLFRSTRACRVVIGEVDCPKIWSEKSSVEMITKEGEWIKDRDCTSITIYRYY